MFATLAASIATLLALAALEGTLRMVDGYSFASFRLIARDPPLQTGGSSLATVYAARMAKPPGVDTAWLKVVPPTPNPTAEADPDLERRYWAHRGAELHSVYVWNANFARAETCRNQGKFAGLRDAYVYQPRSDSQFPRFRFPSNKVLPSGLVTNAFGWRGPKIALNKAQGVVRIAFVGASTTVNAHAFAFSYPEYIGAWLNQWAVDGNLPVRFEVINSGREGTNSNDFAAIVRDEVLSLDPDLVIYYEGSNQFWPAHFVDWPGGALPPKPQLTFAKPGWVEDHSAAWRRVKFLFASKAGAGVERSRELGPVSWPSDLEEGDPDLDHPQLPLNLPTILRDLEVIRTALASRGADLVISSFVWLANEGMRLEMPRHATIYRYLNETFWPFPYAHMRRMADFQNRVFEKYAAKHGLPFIDIAGHYPQDPNLFDDAIHMNEEGVRLHSWIAFTALVPFIEQRIAAGSLPRIPARPIDVHPAFSTPIELVEVAEMGSSCSKLKTAGSR